MIVPIKVWEGYRPMSLPAGDSRNLPRTILFNRFLTRIKQSKNPVHGLILLYHTMGK
jgi:hypothetical protein